MVEVKRLFSGLHRVMMLTVLITCGLSFAVSPALAQQKKKAPAKTATAKQPAKKPAAKKQPAKNSPPRSNLPPSKLARNRHSSPPSP